MIFLSIHQKEKSCSIKMKSLIDSLTAYFCRRFARRGRAVVDRCRGNNPMPKKADIAWYLASMVFLVKVVARIAWNHAHRQVANHCAPIAKPKLGVTEKLCHCVWVMG